MVSTLFSTMLRCCHPLLGCTSIFTAMIPGGDEDTAMPRCLLSRRCRRWYWSCRWPLASSAMGSSVLGRSAPLQRGPASGCPPACALPVCCAVPASCRAPAWDTAPVPAPQRDTRMHSVFSPLAGHDAKDSKGHGSQRQRQHRHRRRHHHLGDHHHHHHHAPPLRTLVFAQQLAHPSLSFLSLTMTGSRPT